MLQYLRDRFGIVAFNDGKFHFVPEAERWSKTSPQHIDVETLKKLFPEDFFDASFTIVRHPVSRLVSAFQFQREVERIVPEDVTFGAWLSDSAAKRVEHPFIYDNHTRPMDEIVPTGAKVFHMEDGFDPLIAWLDEVTGDTTGPRSLPKINERKGSRRQQAGNTVPTRADINLIAKLYARDFERFGYEPEMYKQKRAKAEENESSWQRPLKGILRAIGRT